jgi:methyl-accepting chemotaxis protein
MSIATSLGFLLMLQDSGIRDTVVMVAADRSVMGTLADAGQFIVSVVVALLLAGLAFNLILMRKTMQNVVELLQSSKGDISGAAESVRKVAEDVRGISQTVKTDIGAVSDTVRRVNRGVRRVVNRTEARMRRLDALVGVAQEEAEEFVMSSASALRGVRLGAAALKRSFLFTRRRGIKRKKRRSSRDDRPPEVYRGRRARADHSGERPRIRTKVVEPT